jgi:uncharacterized phosphosugar-binding protein
MNVNAGAYLAEVRTIIDRVADTQETAVSRAAELIGSSISPTSCWTTARRTVTHCCRCRAVARSVRSRRSPTRCWRSWLVAEVVRRIEAAGQVPPIYLPANVPGGDEHNHTLESRYAGRIRRTA